MISEDHEPRKDDDESARLWIELDEHLADKDKPVMHTPVFIPDGPAELTRIVSRFLLEKYETDPTVDDDGDFVLQHMGQPVWICVGSDQPAVKIMARVAHGVYSRRATALEVSILNRDSAWCVWNLRDRGIWQETTIPALPFSPRHLDAVLDQFLDVMSSTRNDLALRTGAEVA